MIFYGPSASVPLNSAAVRSLPSRLFTTGNNTFNLNTGSTEVNYIVAIPNTESISQVLDLDALNANITSQYINNPFNVNDAGGTAVSYKVYTMTNAIPYSSNHRHQVTKG
jgi:actin-like ATPase involved in cell morphogenesis